MHCHSLTLASVATLAGVAAAAHTARPRAGSLPDASATASVPLCCHGLQRAANPSISNLLDVLGVETYSPNTVVGIQCSALRSSCPSMAVVCENNNYDGNVAVGCKRIRAAGIGSGPQTPMMRFFQ